MNIFKGKTVFTIEIPDFELSPYTGMTRQHWKDAAFYLLEKSFSYVDTIDTSMKFPKQRGKSYPHRRSHNSTEQLEGICRTLFLAVPLLKENPDLEIKNIKIAEYYRRQILNLVDSKSALFIRPRPSGEDPSQVLVELGALAISFFIEPEILWAPFTGQEKDALARTMISYADGPTIASNWRFFNIFILSFFKKQGYEINEALLEKYLIETLNQYRGRGWYNDNPAYDYYSMWSFQLYGILWSTFYGRQYHPEIADRFIENFSDLNNNYPYLFSRDGKMIMWGRSISYRMAAVAPFAFMGLNNRQEINYGWMRRIASGVILQFLKNPSFMKDNVPTLGFYGAFEPAVQKYNCRGSVFWMGKVFLGLLVSADSPFWKETENNGPWEKKYQTDQVYNKFQDASEILITNYPDIGASEVRAWCCEKVSDDWQEFRSTENYNRLSYNSAFPWQADGPNGETAMNYVLKSGKSKWEALRLFTFKKFEEGAYHRDAILETNDTIRLQLVDIPLSNGILRVDKNISTTQVKMRLGHYSLPKLKTSITKKKLLLNGYEISVIDNGEYSLAMVLVSGWKETKIVKTKNLNPISRKSVLLNATADYLPQEGGEIFTILMLWGRSGKNWTEQELLPIKQLNVIDNKQTILLQFRNGSSKKITFTQYGLKTGNRIFEKKYLPF